MTISLAVANWQPAAALHTALSVSGSADVSAKGSIPLRHWNPAGQVLPLHDLLLRRLRQSADDVVGHSSAGRVELADSGRGVLRMDHVVVNVCVAKDAGSEAEAAEQAVFLQYSFCAAQISRGLKEGLVITRYLQDSECLC